VVLLNSAGVREEILFGGCERERREEEERRGRLEKGEWLSVEERVRRYDASERVYGDALEATWAAL